VLSGSLSFQNVNTNNLVALFVRETFVFLSVGLALVNRFVLSGHV